MHVLVLGAGVIGITTAYYLSRSGHRVTLLDRARAVAQGASHANGGQLSYSFTDAFAQPSILARLPRIALGRDPAVRIAHVLDPELLAWAARFVTQCTRRRATRNTLQSLGLALRSRALLEELRRSVPFDFGFRRAGKLVLLRDATALRRAERLVSAKRRHGCDVAILSRDEAIAVEPAIGAMDERFSGAIYGECDELGDARLFVEKLFDWLLGNTLAEARLGVEVLGLETGRGRFRGVRSTSGTITGDAAVVCLGAHSRTLARSAGFDVKLLPVRGYSLTLPKGRAAPSCSVTDLDKRILFSPLSDGLRVTGFLDFVGLATDADAARIRTLKSVAFRTAPEAADYRAWSDGGWGGFRAMTPDGQALIGATSMPGVFTNTGHGALGWTLACSSGADVAAAVNRWWEACGVGE